MSSGYLAEKKQPDRGDAAARLPIRRLEEGQMLQIRTTGLQADKYILSEDGRYES